MTSFDEVQRRRGERSDAITAALADVDKGAHGIRNHRWLTTVEYVSPDPVHVVEWCWDCGTNRADAEQRPYPTAWPEHGVEVGFCGYTAKQPGAWWD